MASHLISLEGRACVAKTTGAMPARTRTRSASTRPRLMAENNPTSRRECKSNRFALLFINTAADYSKIGLQTPLEQTPQHGIKSLGLQATPSGRQAKDSVLAANVDGAKKAPTVINNAPTNFNNEVFFILFSLQK
jgi:hypothetical protein